MSVPRRPDPPPLRTDDRKTIVAGTVAFGIAAAVLGGLSGGLGHGHMWWLWTAVAGFVMGFYGLWFLARRRRRGRGQEWPSCSPGSASAGDVGTDS